MAGQRGRDILLKISDGGTPPVFMTLGGIRTRSIQFSAGVIDGTSSESPSAWRELVTGAGVKTLRVQGAGVFKDAASDTRMQDVFFTGSVETWQLVIPDFGIFEGPLQIVDLNWSGRHDGEAEFAVTLESAGQIGFTAI